MSTLSKIFDLQKEFNHGADELNELVNSLYHVGQENLADKIGFILSDLVAVNGEMVDVLRDKTDKDFKASMDAVGQTLNSLCGAAK